jgi:hypothetical protein
MESNSEILDTAPEIFESEGILSTKPIVETATKKTIRKRNRPKHIQKR